MKIIDILVAKESVAKLNNFKFNDFKIVSNVYKLTKRINEILDLVKAEQQKIVDLYTKKDDNGKPIIENNQYQFETVEDRDNFISEFEKMKQTEVDDISRIDIPIDSVQIATEFTAKEMMQLEPIINWI